MDDFASLALQCQGSPPRIAARCSVFAKSDLIHLQQKGTPVEAMLYALANAIGVSFVRTKLDAEGKPVAVDKDGNEIPFHPVEKPRIVVPK